MGGAGGGRRPVDLARAYDGIAEGWDSAAGRVYKPLARALIESSPVPLAGLRVLDLGSGTGAVAEAAEAEGARVVAADRSLDMIGFQPPSRPGAVIDALALPFADAAFDAATAGFLLNHLPAASALAEMARAVRPGGVVLGSTWATSRPDPIKTAIDAVIRQWGWAPPAWFLEMKARIEPISGDPTALSEAGQEAGLVDVRATVLDADLGLRDPDVIVAYRLSLPQIAPWVASLGPATRAEVVRHAAASIADAADEWRPVVILLTARVARQPRS